MHIFIIGLTGQGNIVDDYFLWYRMIHLMGRLVWNANQVKIYILPNHLYRFPTAILSNISLSCRFHLTWNVSITIATSFDSIFFDLTYFSLIQFDLLYFDLIQSALLHFTSLYFDNRGDINDRKDEDIYTRYFISICCCSQCIPIWSMKYNHLSITLCIYVSSHHTYHQINKTNVVFHQNNY